MEVIEAIIAKRMEGLIPIKVDASTGGGLYIIGKNFYDKDSFPYAKVYSCGIGIIGDLNALGNEIVICLYAKQYHKKYDYAPWANRDFPDVKEAVVWYDYVFLKGMTIWICLRYLMVKNQKECLTVLTKISITFMSIKTILSE